MTLSAPHTGMKYSESHAQFELHEELRPFISTLLKLKIGTIRLSFLRNSCRAKKLETLMLIKVICSARKKVIEKILTEVIFSISFV